MTPEAEEIERKHQEIAVLESVLTEREAEYASMCMELQLFEEQYLEVVTPFYNRLDRWKLRILCTQMMIDRLRDVRDGVLELPSDPFAWSVQCEEQAREQWIAQQSQRAA